MGWYDCKASLPSAQLVDYTTSDRQLVCDIKYYFKDTLAGTTLNKEQQLIQHALWELNRLRSELDAARRCHSN